jgi:UDP-N-acetyl-D-mannosaminuronate dehydrogenase
VSNEIVIVAGLGEVGKPLLRILKRTYDCVGIDVEPAHIDRPCSVLHVCYPFQMKDFVGITADYIDRFAPKLTIINSTVAVGTTRKIQERVGAAVAYSPVRGKHARMEQEMLHYQKFLAGVDSDTTQAASQHFAGAGFKVSTFPTLEAGELSKLLETTWLGMLVAWAQEIERLAAQCGASYADVNAFIKEIDYLPKNVFPGHIGGHCVMPNIAILRQKFASRFLDAIVDSNDTKEKELLASASSVGNQSAMR